ncbi:MAG: glutamate racemase [Lachnospiraceae bacterium]|nr:glutamate racemase [Lachnospiraceae bacterium]
MGNSIKPIGVFDSGVGGISVLRELVKQMPEEDYIYFGDSVHAPYGTKPLEEVRQLTINNICFLLESGAKSIVVACNTATSAAVAQLREMYPDVPLVGIEPAIKPAVMYKENSCVVVMATPMTLKQKKFQNLMHQYEDMADIVPLPCPGLMEFVERGILEGKELTMYLENLLGSVSNKKINSVVLGCTHYPFVKDVIQKIAGENVIIFDGGEGTAREMKRRLTEAGLLNQSGKKGKVRFINSLDTDDELKLCEFLLTYKR